MMINIFTYTRNRIINNLSITVNKMVSSDIPINIFRACRNHAAHLVNQTLRFMLKILPIM
jgi:hypothetical protein